MFLAFIDDAPQNHVFDNKVIIHPKYLSNFASSFFQFHKV